ncbi:MAG TPA: flavodoxin domain-containing protein [Chitinophagaceae bacterium]|nr:flavodoxin domain-containing protein [Chitinophagaceae bacterium]
MKGIVIYKGKYGSTKQYAGRIAAATGVEISPPEALQRLMTDERQFIVVCSAISMGKLLLKDWIKKNYQIFRDKKLFLVTVCATPSSEENKRKKILQDNIPGDLRGGIDVHFLAGRLIIERLSWKDRMFLTMGAWLEKDPKKKIGNEK